MVNMERRIRFLVYSPCAMGTLSVAGSLLIVVSVVRQGRVHSTKRRRRRTTTTTPTTTTATKVWTPYHRLLLGLSIYDIIFSTALALGPLPVPDSVSLFPGTAGNQTTCSFQAFLIQWGTASFAYSAMLSIYYLLVVVGNVSDHTLARWVEPFWHILPTLFHGGTALAGFWAQVYNPASGHCWIGTWPLYCQLVPDLPCERGAQYLELFTYGFVFFPRLAYTGIVLFTMAAVAGAVWWRFYRNRRWTTITVPTSGNSPVSLVSSSADAAVAVADVPTRDAQQHPTQPRSAPRNHHNTHNTKTTRLVVTQCLLYAVAYLNCTIWSSITTFKYRRDNPIDTLGDDYWMAVLAVLFFPSQGALYAAIFLRPHYVAARQRGHGRWYAVLDAVWQFREAPSSPSSSSSLPRIEAAAAEQDASAVAESPEKDFHQAVGGEEKDNGASTTTAPTDDVPRPEQK